MSALDLTRLNTTIRRCAATLLDASYTDGIPTETTDVWRTIAADAAPGVMSLCQLTGDQASYLLRGLVEQGKLVASGSKRWTRYSIPAPSQD